MADDSKVHLEITDDENPYAIGTDVTQGELKVPVHAGPDHSSQKREPLEQERERRIQRSWMTETHLGGILERVSDFPLSRAYSHGYGSQIVDQTSLSDVLCTTSSNTLLDKGVRKWLQPENAFFEGQPWVKINDTSRVPFRSICHLEIVYENGSRATGSAWFSGPDTLITAGHNVFDRHSKSWARNIRVIPGRDGRIAPFGETYGVKRDALAGWVDRGDEQYDLGMIKTADKTIGSATGWFGYAVFTDSDLSARPLIQSAGYPGESKAFGTQWYDAGRSTDYDEAFIYYRVDTEAGQSGAPIFFSNKSGQRWVVATHVYTQGTANLGRRVTNEIFDAISNWSS
ncbi:serine protease [Pelagibius sp. Alg239-R121]|uniref:trypsin-like serine peptidase n=1 Tax=Pelagibius sp. Alg239-R121 TaxID=2993448 RepID=UPI0024A6CD9D|nr:hypothetical protein [Pelagibius sp. Alg239-R121]